MNKFILVTAYGSSVVNRVNVDCIIHYREAIEDLDDIDFGSVIYLRHKDSPLKVEELVQEIDQKIIGAGESVELVEGLNI
jgi:hypothetical protein